MEMLRMGEDPDVVEQSLATALHAMQYVKDYQPDHDIADFYRAYKDADFRP